MAFTRKLVDLIVTLASNPQVAQPNTFADGTDRVRISGARCSVRIQNSGAPSSAQAQISVYGLRQSLMDQLATLGIRNNFIPKNSVTVLAGDDPRQLSTVFDGTIQNCFADYAGAPDVPLRMLAQAGLSDAVTPTAPTSFTGWTSVATIMSGFARQLGRGFENNGIDVQLYSPHYKGSVLAQIDACRREAKINALVVNGNVLAIWPLFGTRTSLTVVPIIAPPPEGTMIGYPEFTPQGIIVKDLFNPQVANGGKVQVKSSIRVPKTNTGTWGVYKLDLALDSQVPNGEWMSTLFCYAVDPSNPVVAPR